MKGAPARILVHHRSNGGQLVISASLSNYCGCGVEVLLFVLTLVLLVLSVVLVEVSELFDGLLFWLEEVLVLSSELPPMLFLSRCAQPTNIIPASAISAIIFFMNYSPFQVFTRSPST